MKFLLDTNICIYLIKKKPLKVWEKFQTLTTGDIGISAITVAELKYGVYKSQRQEQNEIALSQFLLPLKIIPFNEEATVIYGKIRANLEQQGKIIGPMDLLIAAHAVSLGAILVTNNVSEFSRVTNLTVINWLK